jgi:hypothetical protein
MKPGDALQVRHPVSNKDEVRIVKMVLSDSSAGINAPFSSDLVSGTQFYVLKLPKATDDPETLREQERQRKLQEERGAFGTYASEGGKTLTYRVKTGSGGYKIVTEQLNEEKSREALLDMRAKKKSDKFC